MTNYQKCKLLIFSIFSILLLIIIYEYSKNGRYVFNNHDLIQVLDTRTGKFYDAKSRAYLELSAYKEMSN